MSGPIERPDERHRAPHKVGARVRHSGARYPEAFRRGNGEVLEAVPWSDGSWEYRVRKDDGTESWWASYHTHAVEI